MKRKNPELAQEVMQYIDDHPERHCQGIFLSRRSSCGTVGCFAGWTALLTGWRQDPYEGGSVTKDGQSSHASEVTIRELGLTYEESARLFAGDNTRDMLRLMVKDYVNGECLRPQWEYQKEAAAK